jgi:hypothetical protein
MHIELLPEAAQRLVRARSRPRQDLVLGYWRELLDEPVEEVVAIAEAGLQAVRAAHVPYLIVAGSEMEPNYANWLATSLPESRVTVWAGSSTSRTWLTPASSPRPSTHSHHARSKHRPIPARRLPRSRSRDRLGPGGPYQVLVC